MDSDTHDAGSPDRNARDPGALAYRRRVESLARGLSELGLEGCTTVVICCQHHSLDGAVARAASAAIGAEVLDAGAVVSDGVRPDVALACEEGFSWWDGQKIPCRVVSNAPGTIWWKLLELRHSSPVGPGASERSV